MKKVTVPWMGRGTVEIEVRDEILELYELRPAEGDVRYAMSTLLETIAVFAHRVVLEVHVDDREAWEAYTFLQTELSRVCLDRANGFFPPRDALEESAALAGERLGGDEQLPSQLLDVFVEASGEARKLVEDRRERRTELRERLEQPVALDALFERLATDIDSSRASTERGGSDTDRHKAVLAVLGDVAMQWTGDAAEELRSKINRRREARELLAALDRLRAGQEPMTLAELAGVAEWTWIATTRRLEGLGLEGYRDSARRGAKVAARKGAGLEALMLHELVVQVTGDSWTLTPAGWYEGRKVARLEPVRARERRVYVFVGGEETLVSSSPALRGSRSGR